MQHPDGGAHGHGGMGHMGGGFGGDMAGGGMGGGYAQNPEARLARLDAKLAATGYCRSGYKQLGSQFQH